MPIVIRKNKERAKVVSESNFSKENAMQKYLIDNPEIVPIYDIEEDARLFVAAREFSTTSGPIDALGFDERGNIYVIETKLFRNPDKRTVLAQAMDYGAALWKNHSNSELFLNQLDEYANKHFERDFKDKFCEFFDIDDADTSIENIKTNLEDGSIKFVVLMDKLEPRLKDLIGYINQNSKFDVYAVELDFYKHEEFEIIIPKLYGAEVRKEVKIKTNSSGRRFRWNDQSFRTKISELPNDKKRAVLSIYDWARMTSDKVRYGSGSVRGSVNPRYLKFNKSSFFTLYSDGDITINFGYIESDESKIKLFNYLNKYLSFVEFNLDNSEYPTIDKELVYENYEKIIEVFDEFIKLNNKEEK